MKIFNLGSINIDHVYQVPHFVRPGETLGSVGYRRFAGGKGHNQSVALARAGVAPVHIGAVGADGDWLVTGLEKEGVDTRHILRGCGATGHAVIQVNAAGENAIVLHGGANQSLRPGDLETVLAEEGAEGDLLLLQLETNLAGEGMRMAAARGMRVVLNPAPLSPQVTELPLETVHLFVVNETEGRGLSGEREPSGILDRMAERFPGAATLLTLGERGAWISADGERCFAPALSVRAVDTTAAGDTFLGYFLAAWTQGRPPAEALARATRAAALCVTRPGAADSIPRHTEIQEG